LGYNKTSSYLSVLRRGLEFFRGLGWKRTLIIQFLGLASSALYALGLASLIPVLNMFNGTKTPLPATINNLLNHIPAIQQHGQTGLVLLTGTLLIFVLRGCAVSLYYGYGGRTTEDYTRQVRNRILEAYAHDREHHAAENAKTKILYLNSQMPLLSSFNWGIIYCSLQIYVLLVLVAVNIYISPPAFGISVCIGLMAIPLTQPLLRKISAVGRVLFTLNHRVLTQSNNFTEGFETITTLNVRDQLEADIDQLGVQAMHQQFRLGIAQGMAAAMPEILTAFVAIGFYFVLGSGRMNGTLIAIAGYSIVRLVAIFGQLNEKLGDLLKLITVSDELHAFAQGAQGRREHQRSLSGKVDRLPIAVCFENVTVTVAGRNLVEEISLTLKGNGIYQFAGANGSGKSTLLRALAGLMPYSGSITIAGGEVRRLTRESLTGMISYHSQDNFLLEGSFLENVLLGNPRHSPADVQHLLAKMGLLGHSMFAQGLDFRIAESASNLSGGERQLICILRTLLRDAPIYLLDEYTNHLGRDVAEKLGHYLRGLHDRMIIMVSHANLHLANKVVVMEYGRLATTRTASVGADLTP
jgi:ABC-type multidrug transport system fused ATPase/permease subunit